MKTGGTRFLNILLSITLIFFAIAVAITINNPYVKPDSYTFFICVYIQVVAGAFAITWSLLKTKKAIHLFVGLIFFTWSLLLLLLHLCFESSITVWWPVFGIFAGLALFLSGLYKYKKIKFGYLFPSCCLVFIDLWYFLFTFQFIKVPFSKVLRYSCPAFFVIVATILIFFFILQQKHKNLVIKDDETGTFSDEELHLEDDE